MRRSAAMLPLATALVLGACCPAAPAPSSPSTLEERIAARAVSLRAAAEKNEPAITARLQALAAMQRGTLTKLEHRFKSTDSIERKLTLRLEERGDGLISDNDVIDALRYTMLIPDRPAGHHADAIAAILTGFESDGQRVLRVKNYWPKGDNYSGVNVVLKVGDFRWELQFHTADSARIRDAWHKTYRILRSPRTSLAERQRIFDQMSKPWEAVAIPDGVLAGEGTLHATEKIILYPRP